MWTDPISLEYAFFGLDGPTLIGGLMVVALLTGATIYYFARRGHQGRGLFFLTLSTSFPLIASAFIIRTLVAFSMAMIHWILEPSSIIVAVRPIADITLLLFTFISLAILVFARPVTKKSS